MSRSEHVRPTPALPAIGRPGKRRQNVAATRERIIQAARDLLVRGGLSGLNLREIERSANVSRSTIHCHFQSRSGLLQAVLDHALQRGGYAFVEDAASASDPLEALSLVLRQTVRLWAADYVVWRRIMALAVLDPEAEEVLNAWENRRYRSVAELTRRLAEHKLLNGTLDETTALIWSLSSYQMFERMLLALGAEHAVYEALSTLAAARCVSPSASGRMSAEHDRLTV